MWKWFALLACLFLPLPAEAQDLLIKDFSAKHVETFIKDVMKTNANKVEDAKENRIVYQTPQNYFDVEFQQAPAKRLVLYYTYTVKAGLEKLNEWNAAGTNLAHAFLSKTGNVVLAAPLNLEPAISMGQLAAFYERVRQEKKEFDDLLGVGKSEEEAAGDLIRQGFPAQNALENSTTSWDIRWDFVPSINGGAKLLRIVSADFKFKDKNKRWKIVRVARNIQLAEAFSAYDDGQTSYLDLYFKPSPKTKDRRADLTVQPTPQLVQCVLPGETLTYSKDAKLKILKEVHDDGLRWMSGFATKPGDNKGYRGEKLVLAGGFQAVNYVYLTCYEFTDDGRIVCRLGFTAHNLVPRGQKNMVKDGDVHLHVGCWRMDFELSDITDARRPQGGAMANDYRILSRRFDPTVKRFKQIDEPFGGGQEAVEGSAEWVANEFTNLRVVSGAVQNGHQRPISYDLVPARFGTVRGLLPTLDVAGEDMAFINADFWITHVPAAGLMQPYHKVPALAKKGQPLKGHAATVWYSSPALHVPRTEDFGGSQGTTNTQGLALTTWIDFTLRPRDLFDSTPLYP